MHEALDVELPRAGERFDERYTVTGRLGEGAAGAVLDATRISDGARVAIKLLRHELAGDLQVRRRFDREASLLESFSHPAVVRVFDHGEAPRFGPYFVMDRLVGETLRSRVASGRISPVALAPILGRVASALEATHRHGVLHGDIKPDNIFLTEDGAVLVDFGSCKVHGLPRLTATGDVAGTPVYMPPELILGKRELDGRVDVYALGVTAYEALTGRLPFETAHPGRMVAAIVAGETLPLPEDLSEEIRQVLDLAMTPDPERRFLSPAAFAAAFDRVVSGE